MSSVSIKKLASLALLIGVVSLMFELLQVRLLSFLIGKSMDVLAIPIALLGLAIGSMFRHFVYAGDPVVLLRRASVAVLPVCAASFLTVFAVASFVFPEVHVALATPGTEASKVLVYGAAFLPPYVVFGMLLATLFGMAPDRIGTLYFFDLLGAAVGCALAPLVLTALGLQATIGAVLLFASLLVWMVDVPGAVRGGIGAVLAVCIGLLVAGIGFVEQVDPTTLAHVFKDLNREGAREVDVRWNAIARTALLTKSDGSQRHVIVQDNGLSNVQVTRWRKTPRPDAVTHQNPRTIPWRLGLDPERILITFAGMGRDMVMMDELAGGKAEITGVELNPAVVGWAHHPQLTYTRLPQFLERDSIQLLAREGRDFLNTDAGTYDLIFIANNGAVHAGRTGHTRKFLDTREALEAYLERLEPDGLLMFMAQPVSEKLASLRAIGADRNRDFSRSFYVFGNDIPELDTLVFKPNGLTDKEITILRDTVRSWKLRDVVAPGRKPIERMQHVMTAPVHDLALVTDDKPFTHQVEWWNFTLMPDATRVWSSTYVSSWAKIFTLLVFTTVSVGVGLVAMLLGTPQQRVPARWTGYLFLSGTAYMCIQIPLIAKTELLVGNPLYAVSVNLAVFLVFNALGSRLFEQKNPGHPAWLAGGVIVAAAWGVLTMDAAVGALLSTPLLVKAAAVAVSVGPVAMVMGMFYPWCVTALIAQERPDAVPMTYGLTTLASVVGSAFAMAAIINLGFTTVIGMGVVVYAVSTGFSRRLSR